MFKESLSKLFSFLIRCGPLFFGVLFFAPVFSEIMNLFEISLAKIPNLYIALFIGFLWGLYASIKRSWI